MNKPLRHVALVVTILFLLLFASTTYIQAFQQKSLNADGRNARAIYNNYGKHRGSIVVDGKPIAVSNPSDDVYGYQRSYDPGAMYAPVTGYQSVIYGTSGIERSLDDDLSGDSDSLFLERVKAAVSGRTPQGANVELTLDPAAQEAAWNALDGRRGAVVALDPSTGAVLAMVSSPSYDPNRLAGHSQKQVREAWTDLQADSSRPLTNRAIGGDLYPPGSTFKLIVAAAALESGEYTKDTEIPGPGTYQLPNSSSVMHNHPRGGTEPCGPGNSSSLQDALRQSCNTSFAELGTKLGQDTLRQTTEDFGFGEHLKIPLGVTPSSIGDDLDGAQLATSSIGQYEDRVTPLQMAMVASAFADDGVIMEPQLVASVRTSNLQQISVLTPHKLGQPVSASNAKQMRDMMEATVQDGTATAAQISGVEVGGKTGTAEWKQGAAPHSWFVGYAQAGDKKVAVAVVIEEGGYGATAATPVARNVMEAVVQP